MAKKKPYCPTCKATVEVDEDGDCVKCREPLRKTSHAAKGNVRDCPSDRWGLPRLTAFIKSALRRSSTDNWQIGHALSIARDKHLQDRTWRKWLEEELNLSKSSAQRLIALYEGYTLDDLAARPGVGMCQLLEELKGVEDDDDLDNEETKEAEDDAGGDGNGEASEDAREKEAENHNQHATNVAKKGDNNGTPGEAHEEPGANHDKPGTDGHEPPAEPAPEPMNNDEYGKFETFVNAIGNLARAEFVFAEGVKQRKAVDSDA